MFAIERREKIYERIKLLKSDTVENLAKYFKVSEVTIRKDLTQLEKENLIVRTFGGVLLKERFSKEVEYLIRKNQKSDIKRKIALSLKSFITDNMSIFIDAGTTTNGVGQYLHEFKNLTIFTNDILICRDIFDRNDPKNNNRLIFTGGEISLTSGASSDFSAINAVMNIKTDIAFIGCDSIDLNNPAVFTTTSNKAHFKKSAILQADRSILVTSSDKVEFMSFFQFAKLSNFAYVVTDNNNKKFLNVLKKEGVKLKIIEEEDYE